jgi:hypothetical protein
LIDTIAVVAGIEPNPETIWKCIDAKEKEREREREK